MSAPLNPRGIELPRERPFYLFPFKSRDCQHVLGTKVTSEYIQFDLENDYGWTAEDTAFEESTAYGQITTTGKHLKLFYCYYEPGKGIFQKKLHPIKSVRDKQAHIQRDRSCYITAMECKIINKMSL